MNIYHGFHSGFFYSNLLLKSHLLEEEVNLVSEPPSINL